MKLTELEIVDIFTEEKEAELKAFIEKNFEQIEVIGVECVMNYVDFMDGLSMVHEITRILTDICCKKDFQCILVMGAETEDNNKIKVKLFDTKPLIQAEFN